MKNQQLESPGNQQHRWFYIGLAGVFLCQLSYFFLGENAHLLVHDNLDSNVAWVKILLDNHMVLAHPSSTVEQVMHGIPRSAFPGYDLSLIWFHFFGLYTGYAINKMVMSLVAFTGMYLLITRHANLSTEKSFIPSVVAMLFALLPHWSFTLSVAGLPLVIHALLNLRAGKTSIASFLMIAVYGFYSSLVLTGIFLFIVIGMLWLSDLIRYRKLNLTLIAGVAFLGMCYFISHYPVFYTMLFGHEIVSHRTAFAATGQSLPRALKEGVGVFLHGQYHAHSLHQFIIAPVIAGLLLMWRKQLLQRWQWSLMLFIVLTSALYGILTWDTVADTKRALMAVFPVQLQRFHFLHPVFWYVLLASCLLHIATLRWGKLVAAAILIVQGFAVVSHHELIVNRDGPSFEAFCAQKQFDEMRQTKKNISESNTVSVGLHPAVAQINGLRTLDGYFPDYPLFYKMTFRKIISGELEKSDHLRDYFDNWGSRCYVFSSELGSDIPLQRIGLDTIQHLDLDYGQLSALGGKYILSATYIDTVQNPEIMFAGKFRGTTEGQDILLYEVK